jgi:hypothetical protein
MGSRKPTRLSARPLAAAGSDFVQPLGKEDAFGLARCEVGPVGAGELGLVAIRSGDSNSIHKLVPAIREGRDVARDVGQHLICCYPHNYQW